MGKVFYINDLVIDSEVVYFKGIKFIGYRNNGSIWQPKQNLIFRYPCYKTFRRDNITGNLYDSSDWMKLPENKRREIKSRSSIEDVRVKYEFSKFGSIQFNENIARWIPPMGKARDLDSKVTITGNKFDFGDILFSTSIKAIKDHELLE